MAEFHKTSMALKSEEGLCMNRHENETKNSSFINSLETQHSFSFIQSFFSSFTPPSSIFQQCIPLPLSPPQQNRKKTNMKWSTPAKVTGPVEVQSNDDTTSSTTVSRLWVCKERRATTWNQWHSSFLCKKKKKKETKKKDNEYGLFSWHGGSAGSWGFYIQGFSDSSTSELTHKAVYSSRTSAWLSTLSLETIATPITVHYTARLAGLLYPIDITDIMAHLHF